MLTPVFVNPVSEGLSDQAQFAGDVGYRAGCVDPRPNRLLPELGRILTAVLSLLPFHFSQFYIGGSGPRSISHLTSSLA